MPAVDLPSSWPTGRYVTPSAGERARHITRALSRAYRRLKKEYNDNRHDRIMQEQVRHDRAAIPGRTLALRYAGTAGD